MSHVAHAHHASETAGAPSTQNAEEILGQLDPQLVRALGLQHKAPRGIPELAVASFDFGTRTMLEAYQLISSARRSDGTQEITITPLGREVINLCSENLPTLDSSQLATAAQEAHDLLSLAHASTIRAVPA